MNSNILYKLDGGEHEWCKQHGVNKDNIVDRINELQRQSVKIDLRYLYLEDLIMTGINLRNALVGNLWFRKVKLIGASFKGAEGHTYFHVDNDICGADLTGLSTSLSDLVYDIWTKPPGVINPLDNRINHRVINPLDNRINHSVNLVRDYSINSGLLKKVELVIKIEEARQKGVRLTLNGRQLSLKGRQLSGISLKNIHAGEINLAESHLYNANFEGTDLSEACLDNCMTHRATYNSQTKFPSSFDPIENEMIKVD